MRKTIFTYLLLFMSFGKIFAQIPNWVWVNNCASGAALTMLDIDKQENQYATGTFSGTAIFGDSAFVTNSESNFIIKMDNNGNIHWAKHAESTSYAPPSFIATDNSGNCYYSGANFLIKYNNVGDTVWGITSVPNDYTSNWAYGQGVVTDISGNAYVIGQSYGHSVLSSNGNNYTLGGDPVILSKVDSYGNIIWLKSMGQSISFSSNANASGIAIDKNNDIYIIGSYSAETIIGSDTLTTFGGGSTNNIFIAKFNSGTGNSIWVKTAGNSSNSSGVNTVSLDNNGNVIIAGSFLNNLIFSDGGTIAGSGSYIAKLNTNGNFIWGHTFPLSVSDLTTDSANSIYLTGSFTNNTIIAPGDTLNASSSSVFVVKIDSNGAYQYSKQSSLSNNSTGIGIRVFNQDGIYVAGNYTGSVNFDTINLNSGSTNSCFIAKLSNSCGACTPNSISQDIRITNNLIISPNPSSGPFMCSFENTETENSEIKIFNEIGQIVWNENLGKVSGTVSKQIDLQKVSQGIYTFQLSVGGQITNRKIIVE